jgi:hypothetical protein
LKFLPWLLTFFRANGALRVTGLAGSYVTECKRLQARATVEIYRFEPPSKKRHPMHQAHRVKEDVVIENEAVVLVPLHG